VSAISFVTNQDFFVKRLSMATHYLNNIDHTSYILAPFFILMLQNGNFMIDSGSDWFAIRHAFSSHYLLP
jgi:hypothetical protein